MTYKSTNSDRQKEFLLNLHRDRMRKIEDENPGGYGEDLWWKASKELLMQHDPEMQNETDTSEQNESQYEVYLPAMQKGKGPNKTS